MNVTSSFLATEKKVDNSITLEAPITGGFPANAILETTEFTGTVTWSPDITDNGTFRKNTAYTAAITITPKEGHTTFGVPADYFMVNGEAASNYENSGDVRYTFSATDNPYPVPGNNGIIITEDISTDGVTLKWTRATDIEMAQNNLKYYVYMSEHDDLQDLSGIDTNSYLPLNANGDADIDEYRVTGLGGDRIYYFNIVVEDEYGNRAAYTSISEKTGEKLGQSDLSVQFNDTLAYGDTGKSLFVMGGSGDGEVSFTSSDESVITVDFDGILTVHKAGLSTITAIKAGDGIYNPATAFIVLTVSKAAGGTVSGVPYAKSEPTKDMITVNELSNEDETGQIIEYAISTDSGIAPVFGWQMDTTFTDLMPNTAYYVFVRTQENENYYAGSVSQSEVIMTAVEVLHVYYTVEFSVAGNNGNIAAFAGETEFLSGNKVLEGETIIFTATPDVGYRVKEWKNGGNVVAGNDGNTLTIACVDGNLVIAVEFEKIPPVVTEVIISPNSIELQKGESHTFVAVVEGLYEPEQSVTWSVEGANGTTAIDTDGRLTIGDNETETSITIKAVSIVDLSISGTAAVTIKETDTQIVPPEINIIDTQIPIITINPQRHTTAYVGGSVSLSVVANVSDGGTLSYQWYKNTVDSNIGGVPIPKAGNSTYTPPTAETRTAYYYTIITNTNDSVNGNRTASITSSVADVTIIVKNSNDNGGTASSGGSSGGDNGNSSGSWGNEDSGNNSMNKDGLDADSPSETESVTISINGRDVSSLVSEDGVLELVYTETNIKGYADATGEYVITVPEQDNIMLSIPITALGNDNLVIKTDFGAIAIPNHTLQELRNKYGDILRLSIRKGSFIVSLTDEDGNRIEYNNPKHPFTITLPYTLAIGQQPEKFVAAKSTGADNTILPLTTYKDGEISFTAYSTGNYDLIYNDIAFVDTENHPCEADISFVATRGLFSGTGNGVFDSDTKMSRAMFVTVLARLDGVDLSGYTNSRFSDVTAGCWYSAAIEWAADMGIVSGVGNGLFDPDTPITYEQMAVLLNNYINFKGYNIKTLSGAYSIQSQEGVSSWAVEAVENMSGAGIISDTTDNPFCPQGTLTRAEAAAVCVGFIEAVNR